MTQVNLIVAMTKAGVIGDNNQLLWHLPNDLKKFKAITMGKPIVMGRKTHESIGRPLPGRQNIILTRQAGQTFPGCDVAQSVEETLQLASSDEVMVIGGAEIYQLFLPMANKLYVTWVDATLTGDTVFPKWDSREWEIQSEEAHASDSQHAFAYVFTTYQRGSKP